MSTVTISTSRLKATLGADGRWAVKGRGIPPRIVSQEELQGLLKAKHTKHGKRQQPRK